MGSEKTYGLKNTEQQNIMMQRTANENVACLRRICKRSEQPKIERLVNNDARLILRWRVWSQVSPSHVTFTVTLGRLFVLRSSPQFLKKREAASSLDIRYIPSQSSADQQSYRKSHARRICFKIQKNPNSLISSHTLIYLVEKIQPNSPFD